MPRFADGNGVNSLLPDWVDREPLTPEDLDNDVGASSAPLQFMPNAIPIYGLQHCVHNLNLDIHLSLRYRDRFFEQLKNFSALLTMPERHRRLTWTCLDAQHKTRFERVDHTLKHWSKTLYQHRWKEVVSFVEHVGPLMPFFRSCYTAAKYLSGSEGQHGEQPKADAAFDPLALEESIKDPFFQRVCKISGYCKTRSVPGSDLLGREMSMP